jgi:sulfotransferase family protein
MPVVFGQGMRRSGTTILFDLFWGDGRWTCWYEPLNRAKAKKGGGSRARNEDYSAAVRELRDRLVDEIDGLDDPQAFNWGAPDHAEKELVTGWPPHVVRYVRTMAQSSQDVFVKFTRASHQIPLLAETSPGSYFVHLVRDPRSVATSHLFRSHPKFKERILAEGCFFTMTTDFNQWKTEVMAEHLVRTRPEYAHLADEPAHVKIMLVWKELYTRARDDALEHFAGRTAVVWHDDLCADPWGTLQGIYATWGWKPRIRQRWWAHKNIRPARPWHEPENPAWTRAMDLLQLHPLVEEIRAASALRIGV